MNDLFTTAESAVEHAGMACGSWHRTLPLAQRPRSGQAHHRAVAGKPEFLAPKAAISAVNRSAFPVDRVFDLT